MLKYNNRTVYDFKYGSIDIVKVYKNDTLFYYKVPTSGSPTPPSPQTPCFGVTSNISTYASREFENVYDTSYEKWYKLNNLNQYEEYGVYANGRTSCDTPPPSRLPEGYTEVEYIENTGTSYIDTNIYLNTSNFEIGYTIVGEDALFGYCHQNVANGTWLGAEKTTAFFGRFGSSYNVNMSSYLTSSENTVVYTKSGVTVNGTTISKSLNMGTDSISNIPLYFIARYDFYKRGLEYAVGKVKSLYIKNNGTLVRDFVPTKRNSDNKYGMYDLVNDVFYTSPNNVDFSGGGQITPTDCVTTYEGKLTIDDGYEYIYSGGSWVSLGEVSGGTATLPNVPFSINYNAKNYNANTKTLAKTSGQLVDVDAVITAGTPTVQNGYLTIASGTRATISGYQTYFNRNANNPNLTIVSKQLTNGSSCHIFANRDTTYNWMYRPTSTKLNFHGSSQIGGTTTTIQPVTESVRVDSNRTLTFNDYSNNTTSTSSNFNYGNANNGNVGLFAGYANGGSEWFIGDFYWIYMSQNTLTDEQVQQVIDYNEGNSVPDYPLYYEEKEAPSDNIVFNSMAEAEAYQCPWVGMTGIINGIDYIFDENYDWVTKYELFEVVGEYICYDGDKYKKMEVKVRNVDDTFSSQTPAVYVEGQLIEAESVDCENQCIYNFCGESSNGTTITINNGTSTLSSNQFSSPYPVIGTVGEATTTIGQYCFQNIKSTISSLTLSNSVEVIQHEAFMETSLLKSLIIPSSVTQIDFWAFTRCTGLLEVIFRGTTPPTFTNQNSGVFHDYCPPVIYVPDSAVSAYRAIDGSVWTNMTWDSNIIQPISNR